MNGRKPLKAAIRRLRQKKQILKRTLRNAKANNTSFVESLKATHKDVLKDYHLQVQALQKELFATQNALAHSRKKKRYQFRQI